MVKEFFRKQLTTVIVSMITAAIFGGGAAFAAASLNGNSVKSINSNRDPTSGPTTIFNQHGFKITQDCSGPPANNDVEFLTTSTSNTMYQETSINTANTVNNDFSFTFEAGDGDQSIDDNANTIIIWRKGSHVVTVFLSTIEDTTAEPDQCRVEGHVIYT